MINKTILTGQYEFDWDEANRYKNQIKHKVTSSECEEIFKDKPIYAADPNHSTIEQRWIAVGETVGKRKLFLAFTIRNNRIRVISARDPDRQERSQYEKKVKAYTKV